MSVPDSEGISLSPRCLSNVTCFNRWSVCTGWWSFCAPQEPGKLGSLFGLLRSWGILTLSSFFSWLCPTPDQAIFQSFTMPQCEARPPVQETVQHLDFLSFCRQRCENGLFYPLAAPSFGKAWSSPEESPCPPGLHANSSSGHQQGFFSVGPWCCSQGPLWCEVKWEPRDTFCTESGSFDWSWRRVIGSQYFPAEKSRDRQWEGLPALAWRALGQMISVSSFPVISLLSS